MDKTGRPGHLPARAEHSRGGWATGYNIVAIPLAAAVLAPWGIVLPPAVGAILMSLSTVVVAINAQLLRGVRL
jgi:P-type Cu2+ transporter